MDEQRMYFWYEFSDDLLTANSLLLDTIIKWRKIHRMNDHVRTTTLSEREMEDYLVENPFQIKDGLKKLSRQFPTDSGPLDMLVLDEDGIIGVVELKVQADEGHLNQGLRYYDYVRTNIETIARSFSNNEIQINGSQEPNLLLISTEFSPMLLRIIKYVSIPVEIYEAIPILLPSGSKQVICRNIEFGVPYETPIIPTKEGHLAYIHDEQVRKLCENILEDFESKGIEVRPLKGHWFAIRKDGNAYMSIACKHKFLSVYLPLDEDNWTDRIRVSNQNEWDNQIESRISEYVEEKK